MDGLIFSLVFELRDFAVALLTDQAPYEWGWRMHPMWGPGWGFGMMLMMALFWGAIVVACVIGVGWLRRQNRNSPADSAMTILRERFARGEIEKDEFESKKRELS